MEYLLRLTDQFSGPMRQARAASDDLNRSTRNAQGSAGAVNNLASAFTGLAAKIGAAFTAYKALEAGFAGIKHAFSVASEMETTQTAFKTMLGSQEAMVETLGKIKALAMETPFEFPELAQAGRMLLAFGETAKDIPDTLRRIGDVSSAVAAPINEIAEIYGKARTQGQLFAEDINQLTGRGIPIIREFAKVLGVPQEQVKKLAEQGKITFPLLDQAFRNLTSEGGQFFGMMAQQAKTSAGLWSTLKDGVNELFLALGTPLNDAIKPVLSDAIALADQLKPSIADLGQHMGTALSAVRTFVAEARDGSGLAIAMGKALWEMITNVASKMMAPFKIAWAGFSAVGSDLIAWLSPAATWLSAKLTSAAELFSAQLMKGMADVMESLPMQMGDAAAQSLRAKALQQSVTGMRHSAEADDAGEKVTAASAEGIAHSLEQAMAAMRDTAQEMLKPAAGSLPSTGSGAQKPNALPAGLESGLDVPALSWDAAREGAKKQSNDGQAPGIEKARADATAPKPKHTPAAHTPGHTADPTTRSTNAPITDRGFLRGSTAQPGGIMQRMADLMAGGTSPEPGADTSTRSLTTPRAPQRGGFGSLDDFFRAQGSAFGTGSLSGRRSGIVARVRRQDAPNVPSPGTAVRTQQRREAAATAARSPAASPSSHPLMAIVKAMQTKLDTLALAR